MKKLTVVKKKKVPFAEVVAREVWHIEHWDVCPRKKQSQRDRRAQRPKETWFPSEEIPAELMYDKFIYQ